ncbi:MAG: M15 family metallopeptidase [Petrimonas sp.]|nr:M15 family metallopeptidase [Petrimonas sp.]MEA5063679.1 M15 family metallopeptidase [Petrimonas sp.]HMM18373.1 M15 family metallopeptidase [Petrimonas sp.]
MRNQQKKIKSLFFIGFAVLLCSVQSCKKNGTEQVRKGSLHTQTDTVESMDTVIIDSRLTFLEATAGTRAPKSILDELILMDVLYKSTDQRLHQGQILTNKKIENDIRDIFVFMLENDFVIEKAIPIVYYSWDDSLSMDDNNTYSFCYRNVSYSKHARGMAIDINPRFNPLRWKNTDRPNQPEGAVPDTTVNGTLYPGHKVVEEFRRLGFRWGHTFSKYYDDHHFEKR